MTTEEKAKAYDEALERARALRQEAIDKEYAIDYVKDYEAIFPELAESKDERIRKAIVLGIKRCADAGSIFGTIINNEGVNYHDVLAWLEKQKEQKPDSLIYDKDLDKAAREFYLSGGADSPFDSTGLVPIVRMAEFGATWMKERMEKEQRPCWNPAEEDVALFNKAITTNASLSPQERAKLDILRMKFKHRPVIEQKEQKPAEWSEDSVKIKEAFKAGRESGLRDGQKYVLNNLDSYGLCKLAEWSEEDEKNLELVTDCVYEFYPDPVMKYKLKDWLKSLRPVSKESLQPHWKPSEDEERLINTTISFLKDFADKGYENAVECIDWLKSKLNGDSGK